VASTLFETAGMGEADRRLLEEITGVGKAVPRRRKRGELTEAAKAVLMPDALWERVRVLLPEHKNTHRFGGGKPRADDRRCMDAVFFVLRTGCQWKALDATGICPGSTAHDRFQEWAAAGVFAKLWRLGLRYYDQLVAGGDRLGGDGGGRVHDQGPARGGKRWAPTPPTGARAGRSGRC